MKQVVHTVFLLSAFLFVAVPQGTAQSSDRGGSALETCEFQGVRYLLPTSAEDTASDELLRDFIRLNRLDRAGKLDEEALAYAQTALAFCVSSQPQPNTVYCEGLPHGISDYSTSFDCWAPWGQWSYAAQLAEQACEDAGGTARTEFCFGMGRGPSVGRRSGSRGGHAHFGQL